MHDLRPATDGTRPLSATSPSPVSASATIAEPRPRPQSEPQPHDGPEAWSSSSDPHTANLLAQARASDDEEEKRRLLDEVVMANLKVARSIAMRYRNRGIALDDLDQVARLGLVKAARRFDTERQNDFLAYAVPTIRGEVRKHFRDHGWTVRPPRRVQELQSKIMGASAELTQSLGRSPRPSELARHLEVDVHDVEEALAADGCFTPSSLDRPVGGEDSASLGDLLPSEADEHTAVDARVILAPAVRRLSERDRRILDLRFFSGWTQEEIARDIGVTQMHVSRLLTKILAELRASVGPATPTP